MITPSVRRLLCVLALTPAACLAQSDRLQTVPFGTRMRVTTCTGTTVTGEYGGMRGDSLALAFDSTATSTVTFPPDRIRLTRTVATDCVRTYSVFERYGKATAKGAAIGAGLGLALMTWAWIDDRRYERGGGAATLPAVALTAPVALILTGVGAWIGSSSGPEQWSAPQTLAAELRPVPRGVGVGFALRF